MKHLKYSLIHLVVVAMLLAACTTPTGQVSPSAAVALTEQTAISTQAPEPPAETQAAATPQTTDAALDPADNVPFNDALGNLEPQDVFQNFYNITQVPRPSG